MTFAAISKRYLDEMVAQTPVNATSLGDHRFDDQLDDVSTAGYDRRAALAHELLGQVQVLDSTELSRANQVDARLLANELEYQIWRIEQLAEWRWNPLVYTELWHDELVYQCQYAGVLFDGGLGVNPGDTLGHQ